MKPLVTIQRIFKSPAEHSFSTVCKNYAELRAATDGLRKLEEEKRASLGYEPIKEVPGIELDSKYGEGSRKKLQLAMTSDGEWKDLYMAAVRNSDGEPIELYENMAGIIYLPDWNELTATVHEVNFEGNRVSGEFGTAHSYSSQLKRRGKMKGSMEPVSVYGNVQTCEKNIILGVRSGMSYPGGHMTTPAGSLKVYGSGSPRANMLRGIMDELHEELGLTPEHDIQIEKLVGVFKDPTLRGFVFSVPTKYTLSEIQKIWEKSVDRKEHEHLFSYSMNVLPEYISEEADRREEIAPKVDPAYPLLPSGVAVLLTQMRRRSKRSFDKTLQALDGLFATDENYWVE